MAMTLRFFNFEPPGSTEVQGLGFVFEANGVRALPEGLVVARHIGNEWYVDDERYMRLELRHALECHVESDDAPPGKYGPFLFVAAVDGVIIADERPFAMLKEQRWRSLVNQGSSWVRIRMLPAAG